MQLKVTHMHLVFPSLCETLDLAIAIYGVQSMRWVTPSLDTHQSCHDFYTIKVRVEAIHAALFLCSKVRPEKIILTVHRVAAVPSDSQESPVKSVLM